MVFDIRGPYDDLTPDSFSKKNGMQIVSGSGADLTNLQLSPRMYTMAKCTATGSGFIVDHIYVAKEDLTGWIDISTMQAHTHTATSDGGSLNDILRANPTLLDTGWNFMDKSCSLLSTQWVPTTSGTGTTGDDTTGNEMSMKLATGATSGSGSTLAKQSNQKVDFSKPSHMQFTVKMSATTALAMKLGVNCETVTSADDATQKYEAQLCTVTNANWNVRTADGSAHSESDTGIAFTTSQTSIRLEHFPNLSPLKVDMYVDSNAAFTKSASNIPTTGSSALASFMKFSLKNSAAADKQALIYGVRLRFHTASQWK